MIKEATTKYPVIELIRKRWSARSFSERKILPEDMNTLFEAASWAASSGNEQPWQYIYAHHGTEGFTKLWECLDGGNRPWNKNAAVLIASVKRTKSEKSGKENHYAAHDTGMANAQLFLQAISMNIYSHPMAGFDKEMLREALQLNEDQETVCMIALGYLDSPEKLEEPFRSRELTARTRKGTETFAKQVK
jgi:nitroreductase